MDTTTHVSHAVIIEREGGSTRVAKRIGADIVLVKGWKYTNSIPSGYWNLFVDNGLASYRELADHAASKVQQRAAS